MVLNIASPPNFKEIINWIEKYKISFFPAVPAMLTAIYNHPDAAKADFSSIITVIVGGAPLPIEVARRFYEVTGAPPSEAYGLSESSPAAVGTSPDLPLVEGSIGFPVADTLIKIVDPDEYAKVLPLGEVGEICIKGPQLFKGYWNNAIETEHALKQDGWFRTGDIGRIDPDGYTYIVDRLKDLILVYGYNVVPRDVEEVLYAHPKILEAAVAGLPHPKKGEMVGAWIVLKENEYMTEDEVIEHCKENLAPYKIPKQITFRDTLPKSMVGKILRKKLRDEMKN